MNAGAYELLATGMRYVFAALMVLIVLRALRGALVDSRRATKLRRLSPETGIIGEMLVLDGSERARTGMRYPLTLEGSIGSAYSADIRVRHSSVRGRHVIYQMTERGLYVRGHAGARLRRNRDPWTSDALLRDGDVLKIGGVRLMLVLTGADEMPEELERRIRRRDLPDGGYARGDSGEGDLFLPRPDADDLFRSNPAGGFEGERTEYGPARPDADDVFRTDADDHYDGEAMRDDTGYRTEGAGQSIFEPDGADAGFDRVRVPRRRDSAADHRR